MADVLPSTSKTAKETDMKISYRRMLNPVLILLSILFTNANLSASTKEGQSSHSNKPASYFMNKISSTSSVAKILAIDKTVSIKFPNPARLTEYISTSAGTFKATVDGSDASFFCVDLQHSLQWYTTGQPHTYTDNGTVSDQMVYVLNNYYPFKAYPYSGSASSVQIEAAAVQVALWHYSDGLNASSVDNVSVKTRALQIISDCEANSKSFYPFETLIIVPASQSIPVGTAGSFFVSAFDANGEPLSGITVTLSTSNGTLSTTTVTTGSNGDSPAFTLTKGSALTATITASASVKLTSGTRYVHSVEPDNWQKLVLATPTSGAVKQVTSKINWYTPTNCVLDGYTTYTQGGWGNKCGTPGKIRDKYFSSVFPGGLTLGGTYKLTLSTSAKVRDFLPQGGTASFFTKNYSDVTTTSAGVLAGQLVALKCNVAYSAAGKLGSNSTYLGELQIGTGPFAGKTVNEFLALSELAIGGGSSSLGGFTIAQYNDAATSINENFDNGTVDKGFLVCKSVNVKASIGDKVWLDTDKDGVQDNGEVGILNVTVKLYDCNNNLIDTKTTDSGGNYLFSNLNPGDYYVKFDLPAGYVFTQKDAGSDDAKDSDADLSTGRTICTTLTSGENDLTWDAGIYQEACKNKIGDFVWRDSNLNGVQDSGEKGIAGVSVELLQGTSVIATANTDANGKYEFANLINGTYLVRVAKSNYNTGGVLANTDNTKWYSTKKNQGSDDTKDSDANKEESVSVVLNCADNVTVDFGFYKSCITITKTANKTTAKPGDKITYSFTIENCGDVQHHGGIDIFDKMLNTVSPYKIKHVDLLDPAGSTTFTMDYTIKNSDCGDLINEVTAEGHPVDGSAYVTDKSTFTVKVECGTPSTTDWSVTLPADQPTCEYEPKTFTANGSVKLTPNPSNGYLVTSWQITYPNDGSVDNTTHTTTTAITGDSNFSITVSWPGIRATDTNVEVQYSVLVLDFNKNPLGKEVKRKYYWNAQVCTPPPSNNSDLKIEKSSSSDSPKCGDTFAYTVKVTNLGPGEAKSVQVTDVLPGGIAYQSSSASQGAYANTTGLWNVGNLANGASATLTISVQSDCEQMNSSTFDLGVAKDYNLFVLQDLNQPSSDTEGKVAVGGNATLAGYSVADKLPQNSGDVLVVGKTLTYTSGRVYSGNVVYGLSTNLPIYATSVDGTIRQESIINFAAAKTYLENLSVTLSGYAVNGTYTFEYSGLNLKGTDPYLNVFKIKGTELNTATSVQVDVPNGSALLVNIDGDGFTWSGGLEISSTAISNVLYNFYNATNCTIKNIDVRGSILAPFAAISFPSGVQNGQMICKSLTGSGQFNNTLFYGNIPADKQVTNFASISGLLSNDPVTTNNSASKLVTVNKSNQTPNTGNTGGGTTVGGGTWQQVGSFAANEIVYSLVFDANGNQFAGTMGGKIYKSTDSGKNWLQINKDMNVGWVWSLCFSNNILFAATEKGVYKLGSSTWSLTNLKDVDVHAIASTGNVLYAGTWGSGVFMSNDNGSSWTELGVGMEVFKVVQGLTVNKNGDVFAGTVGGGIFKLFKGESKWYKYDCGNNIVWALASNDDALFASAYGGGFYRSLDNGSNWEKTSLSNQYIYAIVTDKSGKIYTSSWTSGVTTSTDNGVTWNALGMGGFGVSCLIASPNSNKVYAGTKEGKVYEISFNTVGVNNSEALPGEFWLSQNYPNPFNPATQIQFAIPASGRYSIKIYNVLGQEVSTLLNEDLKPGIHKIDFDASKLASGVYIYRLSGSNIGIAKKMIFLK
jgi:choice-of-anchor A domain-containing protein/uncharacterized repeat protein (TIGR01451 family)